MTQLRLYQRLALYHLRRCLEAGVQRQYVDLPTGTGKNTIAATFAVRQQAVGRVLGLVHRQDLALQTGRNIQTSRSGGGFRDAGLPHGEHPRHGGYHPIPHARGGRGPAGSQPYSLPDRAHR
jgi:superfamily II DNA or RNA helicase